MTGKQPPDRDEVFFWRPEEVPPELTPLERARIAALNVRMWCDWLLAGPGPAPKKGVLTDASGEEGDEDRDG